MVSRHSMNRPRARRSSTRFQGHGPEPLFDDREVAPVFLLGGWALWELAGGFERGDQGEKAVRGHFRSLGVSDVVLLDEVGRARLGADPRPSPPGVVVGVPFALDGVDALKVNAHG